MEANSAGTNRPTSEVAARPNKLLLTEPVRNYQLYLLSLLPLVWLIIFKYVPMYGVIVAFKNFSPSRGILGSPWVGMKYFVRFFESFYFERIMLNTIGINVYELVAGFPVPIILALALNSSLRRGYKKTVQFVVYMPHFISTVVMVGIILRMLSPTTGVTASLLKALGGEPIDFISVPEYFKSIYVWSGVWQNAGWGTIIYLAALSSIDPQLYEAASIDGANRFRQIRHIDIPGILPTIVILLILNTGRMMSIGFEKVFLMQNPLNLESSEVISTYIYKVGLASDFPDFSYGAAIGLFLSVINLIMLVSVNKIAKQLGGTTLW
jgi:ABC-type polysaccharide transport system permease subunit